MGRDKLALELGGKTVVERSLGNLLDADVDLVRLVVAPEFERDLVSRGTEGRVVLVTNPERDAGLSSSMRVGARELPDGTEVVLVALADEPLVEASTIRKLIDVFEAVEARVVYPTFEGVQGHPVLWDPTLAAELAAVEGDRGAKSLLERYRDEARAVPVNDPGVCFDIDTPEDYARARELLRNES